jgi:hypothetical protein
VHPAGDGVTVGGAFLQGPEDQKTDRPLHQREGAHVSGLDGWVRGNVPLTILVDNLYSSITETRRYGDAQKSYLGFPQETSVRLCASMSL